MYDYVIVGSGFFGAVCAYELNKQGKKVLVIEKRNHIGGNAYTENHDGVNVHKYGAHIFHTNDKKIWDYVNSFVEFSGFINSPIANYKGELYNLPFNMNTFYQLWKVKTPAEALEKINSQKSIGHDLPPKNLEEKAISLVGRDIYEKLIKGYTEKQWGRKATDLPEFIINRLPVRYTFNNNYFSDRYQGVPVGGYTALIEKMLENIEVKLEEDFFENKDYYKSICENVIYTGPIDQFYDYKFGPLEYRSLRFENERIDDCDNYQGVAVVNYTEFEVPFTRIIEHKHFESTETHHTIITKEYPSEWKSGDEPYYPINDSKNMEVFHKYRDLTKSEEKVFFGGRLAEYKYYDMHQVIKSALNFIESLP